MEADNPLGMGVRCGEVGRRAFGANAVAPRLDRGAVAAAESFRQSPPSQAEPSLPRIESSSAWVNG